MEISLDALFKMDYTITISLIVVVLLIYFLHVWKESREMPRGPWGIPFLGYIPFLSKEPYKDFTKLTKIYGDVFSVRLGQRICLILNHYDLLKESLVNDGDSFSGKPKDGLIAECSDYKSILTTSGNEWKEQRRFLLSNMRDFGFGTTMMEANIQEEAQMAIEELRRRTGSPVNFMRLFSSMTCNIISFLTFGKRFSYDDEDVQQAITRVSESLAINLFNSPIAIFPILFKMFPKKLLNHAFEILRCKYSVYSFIDKLIENRKDDLDENNVRDITDAYLLRFQEMDKSGQTSTRTFFTDEHMKANILLLFAAGTDTTSSTLCWAVKLLAAQPKLQKQLQQEIDDVIGRDRSPSMADRFRMPLMEAFTLELHRYITLLPFLFIRQTTRETTLRNWRIPKGCYFFVNLWSVHNDPRTWKNPEEFNVKRFLDNKENQSTLRESVIPFSIGRRSCLGESLARMELFIFITTLLQSFSFQSSDGSPLTFESSILTLNKLKSCTLCAIPR